MTTNNYVYGWYHYADGTDKKFRYPAEQSDNLRQDGKRIIVEITEGGDKWNKRTGLVVWGGGNYTVIPTPAAILGSIKSERKAVTSAENGKLGGRPPIFHLWDAELRGMDVGVIVERNGHQIEHSFAGMEETEEKLLDEYPNAKFIRHEN